MMTDIGTKLVSLLTEFPHEWEYRPHCDGLAHAPTSVLLTTIAPHIPRVILVFGGVLASKVLSDADHTELHRILVPVLESKKNPPDVAVRLRAALGIG